MQMVGMARGRVGDTHPEVDHDYHYHYHLLPAPPDPLPHLMLFLLLASAFYSPAACQLLFLKARNQDYR